MAGTSTYEDERLAQVKEEEQDALAQAQETYNGLTNQFQAEFDKQMQQNEEWEKQQQQLQQEQTDFAIDQIEQQKEQLNKDYQKEQSAAYVDYQKESNKYGANAETMADNGLIGTGYSESSKVGMYNTFQNRVASARESMKQAETDCNNMINEAKLANNSALAEIAMQAYQQRVDLIMQGLNYQYSLNTELLAQQQSISDRYHSRYQDVLAQINQEKAFLYQQEQDRIAAEQWQKSYDLQREQFEFEAGQSAQNPIVYAEGQDVELGQIPTVYANESDATFGKKNLFESLTQKNLGSFGEPVPAYDTFGNNQNVCKKEDYYFSNGYQPRYINNIELEKSGMKTDILPAELGIPSGQNIWKAGSQYYAWDGSDRTYTNVTSAVTFSNGYQPRYINGEKLQSVGTIENIIGSYGDIPVDQNVWKAGREYYVWNGKKRDYENITKELMKMR